MPVLAISREIGTGAAEIGQQVASKLGAELVDRRIIDEIARRLQPGPHRAHQKDGPASGSDLLARGRPPADWVETRLAGSQRPRPPGAESRPPRCDIL